MEEIDKFDIHFERILLHGKDCFISINHKASLFAWAKINERYGAVDLITFDQHCDHRCGFQIGFSGSIKDKFIGCKYNDGLAHYSSNEKFQNWDLLDESQNHQYITKEHLYLTTLSDNHIGVAFIKDVVKECYWYYYDSLHRHEVEKCEDGKDITHTFYPIHVSDFKEPENNFILDLDLDFFSILREDNCELINRKKIIKYSLLLDEIIKNKKCVGITIALEPGCCGSLENYSEIVKILSKIIYSDLFDACNNIVRVI